MRSEHPNINSLIEYRSGMADHTISSHLEPCERCATVMAGLALAESEGGFDSVAALSKENVYQRLVPAGTNYGWIRYAAAVIILLSAWFGLKDFGFQADPVESLLKEHYPIAMVSRGAEEEIWAEFEQYYRDDQFALAEEELVRLTSSTETSSFYIALCRLYQEPPKVAQAVSDFKSLSGGSGRFKEQSTWFLALTYLVGGEESNAEAVLTAISESEGHFKQMEARELLDAR